MIMQIIRYGVVGVITNLLGYLVYLFVTWLGVDPKVTVGVLYPIAATIGYFGHSKYSFSHDERHRDAMPRYVVAHVVGYLSNILLLYVFVDKLHYPHQLVQLMAIFILVFYFFIVLRVYVFKSELSFGGK